MCGIGLYWAREGVNYDILERMLQATAKRGRDAFGYAIIRSGNLHYHGKWASGYRSIAGKEIGLKQGDIIIWNNRARPMTEIESTGSDSIQPIIYKDEKLVLVHNGVVANEEEAQKLGYKKRSKIDSEYFLHAYLAAGRNSKLAAEFVVGGSAYILWDGIRNRIVVVKDFKPLAKAYKKGVGYFIVSDLDEFREVFGTDMDIAVWEDFYFSEMQEFSISEIDIDSGLIDKIPFQARFVSQLPEQKKDKVLVMASGGVDSSTAAVIAKRLYKEDVVLVHFDIGQKSEVGERQAVEYLAKELGCKLEVVDMKWIGELGGSVLTDSKLEVPEVDKEGLKNTRCWTPARNLVFVSVLMAVAEAEGAGKIYNGWTLEEEGAYPDNSLGFFRAMNQVSLYGTLTHPKVVMVEANLMKPEIVALGKSLGVDYSKTWSCDEGVDGKQCGKCGACWLRQMAMKLAEEKKYDVEEIKKRLKR